MDTDMASYLYADKDYKRLLKSNLKAELRNIQFYINNLEKLNYPENKKKIDILLNGSFKHAKMLSTRLRAITKQGRLSRNAKNKALKEEKGLQDIYRFEMIRTESKALKELLEKLSEEEKMHEKVVRSLR
jgi:rubrerythrin